jgi:mRNA interferase MazF
VDLVRLRGEVWLVNFDPTIGSEIRKTRPALVVSPDDLNKILRTVIVAPLTSGGRPARFRVAANFAGRPGLVVLDQTRSVARERFIRRLGSIDPETLNQALHVLRTMFAP